MKALKYILIVTLTTSFSFLSHRGISQDGTLDDTFNANAVFAANQIIYDCQIQEDGKYITVGAIVLLNGSNVLIGAVRLNEDGTLDTGYSPALPLGTVLRAIDIQEDGKAIVAGQSSNIWRLNTDGSIDDTFEASNTSSSTPNLHVWVVKIQPDGKILIGGAFESVNEISSLGIARLNEDGSLDNTFSAGLGATGGRVLDIELLSDGKIIIVGEFDEYNRVNRPGIARLNDDGSLDTTFDPGFGADEVENVAIQSDGKIIITGGFTTYNSVSGSNVGRIARLNTDGSLDDTFNTGGNGFENNEQLTLSIQDDDKIIVGGSSTIFNGNTVPRIVRLLPDGSIDNTFNVAGIGPDDNVWCSRIQNDGKILMGGSFSNYNGVSSRRFARLNGNGDIQSIEKMHQEMSFILYPNPTKDFINISAIPYPSTIKIKDTLGKTILTHKVILHETNRIDVSGLSNGTYILHVEQNGTSSAKSFIIANR